MGLAAKVVEAGPSRSRPVHLLMSRSVESSQNPRPSHAGFHLKYYILSDMLRVNPREADI